MMQSDAKRIGLSIAGRVQGVGFRWYVLKEAQRLRLRGWVRNAPDGSVEVRAEGTSQALDDLRSMLERGPAGARVTAITDLPDIDAELPAHFEIVR